MHEKINTRLWASKPVPSSNQKPRNRMTDQIAINKQKGNWNLFGGFNPIEK